ncbi:MAG: InlB B-repeat-containing protein [Lachnospiraceae bacterium]|nr:InlB B-repeat-containing protein [Lachnospiraceae bacterium]
MKKRVRLCAFLLCVTMLVSDFTTPIYASGMEPIVSEQLSLETEEIVVEESGETEKTDSETELVSESEKEECEAVATEMLSEEVVVEETETETEVATEELPVDETEVATEELPVDETEVSTEELPVDEMEVATEEVSEECETVASTKLKKLDFAERAKTNRVYMHESAGCSIASIASVEGYVANVGLTSEDQKNLYYEVKSKNKNSKEANWTLLGYKSVSMSSPDYQQLYQKMVDTNLPVIVHRPGHYAVAVGFEDKNGNGTPESNEFLVMESQKYEKLYEKGYGYPTEWENKYDTGSKIPLNVWENRGGKINQIVYRTTGMEITSIKDEPAKKLTIDITKPDGYLTKGSTFTISGTVKSNYKIYLVIAGVYQGDTPVFTYSNSNIDRYNYTFGAYSELDNAMKFASLSEGDYTFRFIVTDADGVTKVEASDFTVVARANQNKVEKPTLALNTKYNALSETSVTRTAVLKNPSKAKISQAGMVLYDHDKNVLARCVENFNKYDSQLWLYYASDSKTNTNLNITLVPGTQYYYDIYAYVGGEKYTVTGEFETPGTPAPETPVLSCDKYEYAVEDVVTVIWNAVDYVTDGYVVTLEATDGSYEKIVDTKMTSANFVLPKEGEYKVSIIAKGYEWSDTGYLAKNLKAFGDRKVTFVEKKVDGSVEVLKEETVKYKGNASAPPVPTRTGWIFQGWDKSFLNVTEDVEITAQFARNKYTVKFVDNLGTILDQQRVEYEGSVTPPENVEADEPGYVFVGWDSEDYKYVTQNTTITATFVYENASLPIQLAVTSCDFDSDGTGYTVFYDVTNYNQGLTKGRAIVSLMSTEGRLLYTTESNAFTLKASQEKKNVEIFVPYTGDAAYAEVVIVNDFASSIPLSEKKAVEVVRKWSAWRPELPPESATVIESRVEYRYRDKETLKSSSPTMEGWEWVSTEGYWGEYGAWSDWSRNEYIASDSREVESRVVVDQPGYTLQEYYFYKYYKSGSGWMYSYADRTGQSGVSKVEFKNIWINTSGDSRTMVYQRMDDGRELYICSPYQFYKVEYFYKGTGVQTIAPVTHTEWRCRDREYLYRYNFMRWTDWSEWSTTMYNASSTREVEQQTFYRYQTTAVPNDDWDGELYTVSGKVDANLAGKQAILVVYKGLEPADYNNEYLGQTTIGQDGSYSFTFLTREKPSVETGDFTIKLGIEGAKELLYLQTIVAPKPEYQVKFLNWDGSVLAEQIVKEGASAQAPETPVREGYRFVGWDTGLTNVHDNLEIVALYEHEQCTVTFVDWSQDTCKVETYNVGADIIYPSWKEIEGYEFMGWYDEAGNSVSVAEKNLVLTAIYEEKEFTVNFYEQDGTVLSSQTVKYGEAAYAPIAPEIEGQRFACWSTYEYSKVQKSLDIFPSYEYYETTASPKADVKSCTLESAIEVSLSCDDPNATIFYTTDGTTPDIFAKEYTAPIVIDQNVVLKFFARSDNKNDSEIVSEAYLMMNAEDDQGAIVIKKDQLNLQLGGEAPQITYFLYHEDENMGVEFHSLNEAVVSVDADGQLYINNVGTTQIFVVTKDYRYADYCDITVTSDEVKLETLAISEDDVDLYIGDEMDLDIVIAPIDATYQEVVWGSEDESVVSINQEGHLVANAPGNTYITAHSYSGSNIAYCFVSVENSSLVLSEQEIVLAAGEKYQLNAKMTSGEQKITWKTDSPHIISVSSDGLVTAYMAGLATVLVTAENGDFRTCVVRVTNGEVAPEPPSAPVIEEVTATTITVVPQEGCEYSFDAVNWTSTTIFRGLTPDTTYTIFARVKATDNSLASSASKGTDVRTREQGISVARIESQEYTGKAIKPEVVVYYGDELLTLGKDYTVSYKNNTNVSVTKPTAVITGKGNYSSSIRETFEIVAKDINSADIEEKAILLAYKKSAQKPVPTLSYNGKKLVRNKDFTINYISTEEGAYCDPGTYQIEVIGKGNYTGTRIVEMQITDRNLMDKAKVSIKGTLKYTGESQEAQITVTYKGKKLVEDTDYKVVYDSTAVGAYVMPGVYPVKVIGINDYVGEKSVNMKITGISIKKSSIYGITNLEYTGNECTHDNLTVVCEDVVLVENNYYTVSYSSNIKAGKAKVEIVGINGYEGKVSKSFTILPYDMQTDSDNQIIFESEIGSVPYVKGGCKPKVQISFAGILLEENVDYTLKYANNTAVNDGTNEKKVPTVKITGKGNFKGKIDKEFVIEQQDIGCLEMQIEDVVYKNKKDAYKVKPVLYDVDGKKLAINKDYSKTFEYSYSDGSPIGVKEIPEAGSELMITVKGVGNYDGEITMTYRVVNKKISNIRVNKVTRTYTGEAIELKAEDLVLTDGQNVLVEGRDYEIIEDSYTRNVNPGTASFFVRGLGDYGGQKKINFTISKKKFF